MISGAIWGVLVSAVVLAVTSLNSEPPPGARPPLAPVTATPDLPEGAADLPGAPGDAIPGGSTDPGGAPAPSETPEVSSPAGSPAAIAALPEADTAPPAVPQTGDADRAIAEPAAPRSAPVLGGVGDEPVSIVAGTEAPPAPEAEAAPEADRQTADPVEPPREVNSEAPGLAAPEPGPAAPELAAPQADVAPGPRPLVPSDPEPVAPDTSLAGTPETASRPEAETEIALAPEPQVSSAPPDLAPPAQGEGTEADAPAIAPPAIDDLPPLRPDDPAPDGGAVLVEVPEAGVGTGSGDDAVRPDPAGSGQEEREAPLITLRGSDAALPEGTAGIRVIRPEDEDGAAPPADIATGLSVDPDAPALVAHAADWAPLGSDLPLMSVILMDEGVLGEAGAAAVSAIPFPVSVAIDATQAGAAERIASYRAAGIEVLAIARLPDGATPQDAEVILSAAFEAAEATIALLDPGDGGLQGDREVTELAMARLAEAGRGFVTASRGLNTALRVAEAEGVAAEVLYRDLDDEGQDARVIRRFLDQAAFRARQQSGVVLLARVRPDTISALTLWGTANRASQIELAPVSAVLTAP